METKSIKISTIEKVLNYLGSKPYVEVEPLIRALIEEANSEENKPNSEERSFKIETLNAVLNYLGTKAFIEVEALIKGIISEAQGLNEPAAEEAQ